MSSKCWMNILNCTSCTKRNTYWACAVDMTLINRFEGEWNKDAIVAFTLAEGDW